MGVPELSQVTVVVLAWNSAETLVDCLQSAVDQGVAQVLLVDNGSVDGSAEIAKGVTGVDVVRLPHNVGFAGGQVEALGHSRGEVLVLLNSDARLLPGAIERMLRPFADPRVAAVGCRALPWDPGDLGAPVDRIVVHPVTAHTRPEDGTLPGQDVNSLSGAALALRRSALVAVGGFEQRFFAYYEETDLLARLKRDGWRIEVAPDAGVRHKVAASLGEGSPRYLRLMTRNRYLFALRNFDRPFVHWFVTRYVAEEVHSALTTFASREGRARARGALEGLLATPRLLRERRGVVRSGIYNRVLIQEEPPRVSVVIANFNHEGTVLEALGSALRQTLAVSEVIVVDDGSTDGSLSRLRESERQGECRVVAQARAGVVAARNAGAAASRGDWLVFLDADDQLAPEYVEKCWDTVLRARGRVGVVTTGVLRVQGDRKTATVPPRHRLARLAAGNYVHCASLLRREAFEEVGGFAPEMRQGYEDWDLFLAVAGRGWRILRVRQPLLRYRVSETSRNAGAVGHERELRTLLRTRHPEVYGPGAGRTLSGEAAVRTFVGQVKAVVGDTLRGDLKALRGRVESRRSRLR